MKMKHILPVSLIKQLAIPLGTPKTVAKCLVISLNSPPCRMGKSSAVSLRESLVEG
jgi:hypothetical protein